MTIFTYLKEKRQILRNQTIYLIENYLYNNKYDEVKDYLPILKRAFIKYNTSVVSTCRANV